MRKIGDFKNNTLKVERIPKTFENLNSFETMLKMLKTMQIYIKKSIFLDFCCFSLFLDFSENLSKHGSKIRKQQMPPLYNAYEAKLLNVLHSKLCKENLSFCLPDLLNIHSSKDLFFLMFLSLFLLLSFSFSFSFSFFFLFFINLRSHLAISLNQN